MKTTVFRNGEVEVHSFEVPAGQDLTLTSPIGADQKAFLEENGWAYAWGKTVLLEGECTLDTDALPEVVTVRPNPNQWVNGVNTMTGNPHTYHAITDMKLTCLAYRDRHLPGSLRKVVLRDAEEYPLDEKGWLYVGSGSLVVDDTRYRSETILKIENCDRIGVAVGETFLSFIGL